MAKSICWIPGWASTFSLWKDLIQNRWPSAEHHFIEYPEMLRNSDNLCQISAIQDADHIVAWSLGSLLALQVAPRLRPQVSLVAVSPITWFCHPELGWSPRILSRMVQQLRKDPRAVLEAFAQQMGPTSPTQKEAWIQQALSYSLEDLVQGLELLSNQTVSHLDTLARQRPLHLIAGGLDEIVSPDLVIWLSRELHPQSVQMIPHMGHWPFSAEWELPLDFYP